MKEHTFRLGFDIGGTFTDFVLIDEQDGTTFLGKCLTTPGNPAEAVLDGLKPLLKRAGIEGESVSIAIHATTLVTNALIEKKGASTALLTTEGFRDVLEMGTEIRYDIYDLFLKRPEPLVPRGLRYGIDERMWRDGTVLSPLDVESVEKAAHDAAAKGVDSVAICFLHSFRNDSHEVVARDAVQNVIPNATISISSEVAPEIREYERLSTTVANAYVQPILHRYINEIQDRLQEAGYRRRLFLMLSSGGTTTADAARRYPIRMAESGPAAGVLAATYLSKSIGVESFVSFDMGGTTAKIALVHDGRPTMAGMMEVARVHRFKRGSGIPIKIPVIDLMEIGAGGGSIANVDSLGLLAVGPRSAGSDPGPACYGLGGTHPTVTDANLLLGYLAADNFLGGEMVLDREASAQSVSTHLAKPLGMSVAEAAQGIYDVVNQNMLSAMKVHIAERGTDPRHYYLFAFGGAGPVHAYELARLLGMKGVIVPLGAGTASALGLVVTAPSFEFARSFVTRLDRESLADLLKIFGDMESEGRRVLQDAGVDTEGGDISIERSADLRHLGQGHELNVVLSDDVLAEGSMEAIAQQFYQQYRIKYGHALTHLPIEMITCRCNVRGPEPAVPRRDLSEGRHIDEPKGRRSVWFTEIRDYVETPILDRYNMSSGRQYDGPVVIEERECTTVVGPSGRVRVDPSGHLIIDLQNSPRDAQGADLVQAQHASHR